MVRAASTQVLLAVVITTIACNTRPSTDRSTIAPAIIIGEPLVRHLAITSPSPEYVPVNRTSQPAVPVVAAITIGTTQGPPAEVRILQAPSEMAAESVKRTLRLWVFQPAIVSGTNQAVRAQGKLTFYFCHRDTMRRVLGPDELAESGMSILSCA